MPTAKSAPLRIAMAQINPVLGDLEGNSQLILGAVKEALVSGADVVLFSEMVLTGYPVEDLALRPAFQSASKKRVNELAEQIEKIGGGELLVIKVGFFISVHLTVKVMECFFFIIENKLKIKH